MRTTGGDAGAGGDGCTRRPLSDHCDGPNQSCPTAPDAARERGLCRDPEVTEQRAVAQEVDRYATECGGMVFVEIYEFFTETWEYDETGTLVSNSSTTDVSGACDSEWGAAPCARLSESKKVVCEHGVMGTGGAGSAGAGGAP